MSQFDFGNLVSPLPGAEFIDNKLEPWRDALHSFHAGNSRPSYAIPGLAWINSTDGNAWVVEVFNGTVDISIGTLDNINGVFIPAGGGTVSTIVGGSGIIIDDSDPANPVVSLKPVPIGVAASDEISDLTTGTAKVTFRMPHALTLTAVRASVSTASSSGLITVDINKNGTTVLSTKLTIDANEKTSVTAATPPVISVSSFSDDDEVTIDIDGAGTGAKGLKVWLIGTRS